MALQTAWVRAESHWLNIVVKSTIALCIVSTAGCANKTQECNRVIAVLNKSGDSINSASAKLGGDANNITSWEEIASAMDSAADNVKKVESKDADLRDLAKQYEDMLRNGAKSARDFVKATKDGDLPGIDKASGEIGLVKTTEAAIVDKVNTYCSK